MPKPKPMGLHVQDNLGIDLVYRYVAAVRPPVIKFLSPAREVVQECLRLNPGMIVLIRNVWSDQDLDRRGDFDARMVRWAREWRDVQGIRIEGWNEFGAKGSDKFKRFAKMEADFARKMLAEGVGAAIGGYSTGFVDESPETFDACRPIFEVAHANPGRVLYHFHEYSGPYAQYMVQTPDGLNQWARPANVFTGASAAGIWDPRVEGWLTLRYRKLRKLLVAAGLTGVQGVISESLIDNITPRPGGQGAGWADFDGTEWSKLPGIGDFADQVYWFGRQVSNDDWVVGWTDFGFGTRDPKWNSFDLTKRLDMFERVIAAGQRLNRELGAAPVPAPPPAPSPSPGPAPVPVPAPVPEPPILTTDVEHGYCAAPKPAEGWAAFAGRASGRPTASYATRLGRARAIVTLNGFDGNADPASWPRCFREGRVWRLPPTWFLGGAP